MDVIYVDDRRKIAVMHIAIEGHYVIDNGSFTRDFYEVTENGKKKPFLST